MSSKSSPVKSSSSDADRRSHLTSQTTTVPEVSSASSSTKSEIVDLKKKLELLKVQLKQRDKELEKQKWERVGTETDRYGVRMEISGLKSKCDALSTICEDLMKLVENGEAEERRRQEGIENIYKTNLRGVSENANQLKEEVGRLRQQLSSNDTKISAVIHENSYLRWENEALAAEIEALKKKVNEENLANKELKAELVEAQKELRKLEDQRSIRFEFVLLVALSLRVGKEVTNMVETTASQLESARRAMLDREKEYGITLTRLHNELDFLRSELARKDQSSTKLTTMLDDLINDNKQLYDEQTKLRQLYERTASDLWTTKNAVKDRQQPDLRSPQRSQRTTLGVLQERVASSGEAEDLVEARTQIRHLQTLVEKLRHVADNSNMGSLRNQLKQKLVDICKLEDTVRVLATERDTERTQRENSTVLLLEMTKDMKSLLAAIKTGHP